MFQGQELQIGLTFFILCFSLTSKTPPLLLLSNILCPQHHSTQASFCSPMAGAVSSPKNGKPTNAEDNQEDPRKFYYHFLYKAVMVAVFLVILPLFPSQAPEFINQSVLTRNWEFLHLILVAIVLSYGLFSRRNDETEKESNSKFDNAQSFVSRLLQVSSFFEDEVENPTGFAETNVQSWNGQYYRNKPVVVAPKHSDFGFDKQSALSSKIGEKPLLLPVRSLKSLVSDSDPSVVQSVVESNGNSSSPNRSSSKSGAKKISMKLKNGEPDDDFGSPQGNDSLKENVVLPSPIPRRSRSGKMEAKQEVENLTQYTQPPSTEESEFSRVKSRFVKSQTLRSSRSNSMSSSPRENHSPSTGPPKELSPSPSFSSESQAKIAEDFVRKKGFYKSSPPPPPPPPPIFQKSISMKPRSNLSTEGASFEKDLKQSSTSEGMELKPRGSHFAKNFSGGKSVNPVRAGETVAATGRGREIGGEDLIKEPATYDNMSFRSDKLMGYGSVPLVSKPPAVEFAQERKVNFLDKVVLESDEDTETEEEDVDVGGNYFTQKYSGKRSPPREEITSKTDDLSSSSTVSDEGPDVDKKADEFIAKFREQIRLQRIESFKRSAKARNSPR